jgi:putative endonuclease
MATSARAVGDSVYPTGPGGRSATIVGGSVVGWWVYVLRCADRTLYTGVTTDPDRRVREHDRGTASRYTRARRPVELVHIEPAATHAEALRREIRIKRLPRSAKLSLIGGE